MKALLSFVVLLSAVAVGPFAAAVEADDPPATGVRSEPNVKHTVIEDDGARIDELRVRGQTQRITVTPKGAIKKSYEIIPADGARDMSDSAGSSRGAAGKRVWHILSF